MHCIPAVYVVDGEHEMLLNVVVVLQREGFHELPETTVISFVCYTNLGEMERP